MSALEQSKESMMLLITMFVMIFVTIMFYSLIGNFQIGNSIDISNAEAELVSLRALKCLGENLEECFKQDKYGIKINYNSKTLFVNEKLYNGLFSRFKVISPYRFKKNFKEFYGIEQEVDSYVYLRLTDSIRKEGELTNVSLMFKK
jgi:hypothetical protein